MVSKRELGWLKVLDLVVSYLRFSLTRTLLEVKIVPPNQSDMFLSVQSSIIFE